jgi:hypothetical protein
VQSPPAPSCWKTESTVIADTASLLAHPYTVHVFPDNDTEWKLRIESELVIQSVDLQEPDLYPEVKELWAGLCKNRLSYYSRPSRIDGGDTNVPEIAPSLWVRQKRPDKFHWRVDDTCWTTDVGHGWTIEVSTM